MNRKIIETEDGSKTIFIDELNETYHSKHGAVQEARHVFIDHGLKFCNNLDEVKVLEIGLGTGLNAFITLLESELLQKTVYYYGVEKYPISLEEFKNIDFFDDVFKFYPILENRKDEFLKKYENLFFANWEEEIKLSDFFYLKKLNKDFYDLKNEDNLLVDIVYFDAFGSRVQPDLWEEELLTIIASLTKEKSIITTYAAKGSFKRALVNLGFVVQKYPGPPGKREMMVAFKNK